MDMDMDMVGCSLTVCSRMIGHLFDHTATKQVGEPLPMQTSPEKGANRQNRVSTKIGEEVGTY